MDPWLFKRISVRHLIDGEAFDVIGRVIYRSDDHVHLMRRNGEIERVHVPNIIAAREVPDDVKRLRPAVEAPLALITDVIANSGLPLSANSLVLVSDVYRLANTPSASKSTEAAAAALSFVPDPADLVAATFISGNEEIAQVRVCGDWLVFTQDAEARATSLQVFAPVIFDRAVTWGRERGGVYALMLVDDAEQSAVATWRELGFEEYKQSPAGGNDPAN